MTVFFTVLVGFFIKISTYKPLAFNLTIAKQLLETINSNKKII